MEGQSRPSAGIALLENKIQDLEERLRSEERYDRSKKETASVTVCFGYFDESDYQRLALKTAVYNI